MIRLGYRHMTFCGAGVASEGSVSVTDTDAEEEHKPEALSDRAALYLALFRDPKFLPKYILASSTGIAPVTGRRRTVFTKIQSHPATAQTASSPKRGLAQAESFASPFSSSKVAHQMAFYSERFPEKQPDVTLPPGIHQGPMIRPRMGSAASAASMVPRRRLEGDKDRKIGPGTYNPPPPMLSGKATRAAPFAKGPLVRHNEQKCATSAVYMPSGTHSPSAPGQMGHSFARSTRLASGSEQPSPAPGQYNPQYSSSSSVAPSYSMGGRMIACDSAAESSPGTLVLPAHVPDTSPAGAVSPSFAIAPRPYLAPPRSPEARAALDKQRRSTLLKHSLSLSPAGLKRSQSEMQLQRERLHARTAEALLRRPGGRVQGQAALSSRVASCPCSSARCVWVKGGMV